MGLQCALADTLTQKFSFGRWRARGKRRSNGPRAAVSHAADSLSSVDAGEAAPGSLEAPTTWYSTRQAKQKLGQVLNHVVNSHRSLALQSLEYVQQRLGWSGAGADDGNVPPSTSEERLAANIAMFLAPATTPAVAEARLQADLSNLAYDVTQITPEMLHERYGLNLVASSLCAPTKRAAPQPSSAAWTAANEAATEPPAAISAAAEAAAEAAAVPATATASNIVPLPDTMRLSRRGSASGGASPPGSPRGGARPAALADVEAAAATAAAIARLTSSDHLITVTDSNVLGFVESVASMARDHPERLPASPTGSSLRCAPYSFGGKLRAAGFDDYPSSYITSSGSVLHASSMRTIDDLDLCPLPPSPSDSPAASRPASPPTSPLAARRQLDFAAAAAEAIAADGSNLEASAQSLPRTPSAGGLAADGGAAAALAEARALSAEAPAAQSSDAVACAIDPVATSAPQETMQWFIADDPATNTTHFVIQGSVTWDHWKINLQFDPVTFEAPDTGVKIHRGIYEAAKELYEKFAPYVAQKLAAKPDARFSFSGHSLGGSLATVLMLLFVYRQLLAPGQVAQVHTFGAPAVFCNLLGFGASPSASYSGAATAGGASASAGRYLGDAFGSVDGSASGGASSSGDSLLSQLGLSEGVVHNVIMHRDIVPRAFVCDYTLVSGILQQWMPSFKDHTGLASHNDHKMLYHFLGQVEVLQPPTSLDFVAPGEQHDMLPAAPNLYRLREPPPCGFDSLDSGYELTGQLCPEDDAFGGDGQDGGVALADAVALFMNNPHPLSTLSDPASYGASGAISRFHNPDNYTRALTALLQR